MIWKDFLCGLLLGLYLIHLFHLIRKRNRSETERKGELQQEEKE